MLENQDVCFETEESMCGIPPTQDKERGVTLYEVGDKMEYPYIVMEFDEIREYTVAVLKNTLEEKKFKQESTPEGYYNVYLRQGEVVVGLGMLHSHGLKSLISSALYRDIRKKLVLKRGEIVEGDMMYAYCTTPMY